MGEDMAQLLVALVDATQPDWYDGWNCRVCQPPEGQWEAGLIHGDRLELGHQPGCVWLRAATAIGWVPDEEGARDG